MLEGFGFSKREQSDDYKAIRDWDDMRDPDFPLWSIVGMVTLIVVISLVAWNS